MKLFIATPMYGGMVCWNYEDSCFNLATGLANAKIPVMKRTIVGNTYVDKGRNDLVKMFLQTNATHLMFIDADIGFDPNYVYHMLKLSEANPKYKILAANYPKKIIRWEVVKEAAKLGATAGELSMCLNEGTVDWLDDTRPDINSMEPFAVKSIGTGFMLIDRSVFYAFRNHYPELQYGDGSWQYFHAGVVDGEFMSDDAFFCMSMRRTCETIWLCPWMTDISHFGSYTWGMESKIIDNG